MEDDKRKERNKKYYEANKEKRRLEYEANKELYLEKNKEYKEKNQDKIKLTKKIYNQNNKEKHNQWQREQREKNPLYKLSTVIRANIYFTIKNKKFKKLSKTELILGCSFQEFKDYLESKFETWMNWDNQGNPKDGIYEINKTWDLDHITPISTATNEIELLKLNHYTNFQPLCSYMNRFVKKDNNAT